MTLSAGAVARELGISPATLRTWARRYGLEPSARSKGSHRRYSQQDIDRLAAMQRLMRVGVPASQAAAQVVGTVEQSPNGDSHGLVGGLRPGRVRDLWAAARNLDSQRCTRIISQCLEANGVLPTWEGLVRPVLQKSGHQWDSTRDGVDVEHVLSDAVRSALTVDVPVRRAGVLMAATSHEQHVLPMYALRASLAEHGIGVDMLSARTPSEALGHAVARARPTVVVLWALMEENADPRGFDLLPRLRPRPAIAVAGPGWSDLPGATHIDGLEQATDFVRFHV